MLNLNLSRLGVTLPTTAVEPKTVVESTTAVEPTTDVEPTTVVTRVYSRKTVKSHQVVWSLQATGSLDERRDAILAARETVLGLRNQIARISPEDRLGDFRALLAPIAQLVARGELHSALGGSERLMLSEGSGDRSKYERLMADVAFLTRSIAVAVQAYAVEYVAEQKLLGLKKNSRLPVLDGDQYLVLAKKRLALVRQRLALQGIEWYLATTPDVLAAQQAKISDATAKVVKAETALKAAKASISALNVAYAEAEDDVVREDLRRAIRSAKDRRDALDNQVDNLSARLNELVEQFNPFLKDGEQLPDQTGESMEEWTANADPDFEAIAAKRLKALRDNALWYTHYVSRYDLADAESGRVAEAVAAAKLPSKCAQRIVQDIRRGHLHILVEDALDGAIKAQGEAIRAEWASRIKGMNIALADANKRVERFVQLAKEGKLTEAIAVAIALKVVGHLEGEGKALATLEEAKSLDKKWLISGGKALLVPNLPKSVVNFYYDGFAELSAVSQLRLLPEWAKQVAAKAEAKTVKAVETKVETKVKPTVEATVKATVSATVSARSRI